LLYNHTITGISNLDFEEVEILAGGEFPESKQIPQEDLVCHSLRNEVATLMRTGLFFILSFQDVNWEKKY